MKSNGRVPENAKLYTADWGGGYWYVHSEHGDFRFDKDEFASMNWIDADSYLVVEYAHIQVPRKKESLAQVYTAEQLCNLYDTAQERNVQCLWFPQHLTARVRAEAGLDSDKQAGEDAADACALYDFVRKEPVELHKPRYSFEPSDYRQAVHLFKRETNIILNWGRSHKNYETASDDYFRFVGKDDACRKLLLDANIGAFESSKKRPVKLAQDVADKSVLSAINSMSMTQFYTAASLVVDPCGHERQREDTEAMPGVCWLMRNIVATTPFHHKGGLARSNFYFHGVRNYCSVPTGLKKPKNKKMHEFTSDEKQVFRKKRQDYMKAIKWLIKRLQSAHKGQHFGLLALMCEAGSEGSML